ncbi:non-ribosomal peptide synthetase [Streptosporangium sp. CA-135522]|uniref:non-ribosomal peptide synthetase n=1 Tax=Streptosporangium sp. CA-135522 TaxID=3240072 RepID=UPI003D8A2808
MDSTLSPQQRLMAAASPPDASCVIGIDGELDVDGLRARLERVALRHDLLGAHTFHQHDGDAFHLDKYARRGNESPLHATLVRREPFRHELVLTLPALRTDARGLRNLFHEVANGDEREVVKYAQVAAWQNALIEQNPATPALPAPLPFEPGGDSPRGPAARSVDVDPDDLDAAAARCGVSTPDFLLACWTTLIWQQTGTAEPVVGLVCDGRVYQELEPVIGPLAKSLPVVARLADTDPFGQVAARIRHAVSEALEGESFWDPAASDSAWGFEYVDLPSPVESGGAVFTLLDHFAWTVPIGVQLRCQRGTHGLRLTLEFEQAHADAAMMDCLLEELVALARNAQPETALGALSAVGPAQAERLAGFNRTAVEFADARCAHELFEEQAAKDPARTAVTADGTDTSYGELNARANHLARRLVELGAGAETLVGLCLERGLDMLVAVLAVHKAGAAYVPIDPSHPAERIQLIVEDTSLPIMIARDEESAILRAYGGRTALVGGSQGADGRNLDLDIDPDQLAYVIHTSGSTGRPKGVQVSHRAFANFLHAMRLRPGIAADDSLVAVTTLSFDISGLELYLPLTVGARVTIADRATAADPAALSALLDATGATMLQATPVTWRMLVTSGWAGRPELTALAGGEALPPELAAELRPRVRALWNMYGPTETTIWSTCGVVGSGPMTVGLPIANTCVHVLDDELRPLAIGLTGEVYIGGSGLARGYAGRPGLSAERFVPDPFCGGRMYRTGDLARLDPHGRLRIVGRSDGQVKIRGFRIELGEVESVLARHPAVRAAVVTTAAEPSGGLRLDAHVLPAPGALATAGELRSYLRQRLPEPMVPARIGIVGALPLTANGKIDRAALPEVGVEVGGGHVPAGTGLEHALAGIWREVLGMEAVGVTDNFFDLGGHSVLLVQMSSLVAERLSMEITPLTILEHPTVASLARHLSLGEPGTAERPDIGETDEARAAGGRERLLQRRTRTERQ